MKKVLTSLMILFVFVGLVGCQKKITASINYSDPNGAAGGMHAEMPAKSTVKDLFEELSKGTDFVYELDDEGYVVSVNGKGNDDLGYWEITVNGNTLDDVIGKTVVNDGDTCDVTYIPNASNPIVGGWKIAEVGREELTDEEKEMFTKAMETVLGETYEPVCVLATQVVSGTNYAFLARGTVVSNDPVSNFNIVKIYKDLQGEVSLTSIADINIGDIQSSEDASADLLGGWTVTDTGKPGSLGSEQAQASFDKAMEGLVGVGYNPIQLLATQVVSGTNYIALARGKVVAPDTKTELYVVTWYEDLNGNSSITEIKKLDLLYYVQ